MEVFFTGGFRISCELQKLSLGALNQADVATIVIRHSNVYK